MENVFQRILAELENELPGVASGNMMRSPAITFQAKVFCFYYDGEMCFKLGQKAADYMVQYEGSRFLNPFKNKPPMKGWLVVPSEFSRDWKLLATEAYQAMIEK